MESIIALTYCCIICVFFCNALNGSILQIDFISLFFCNLYDVLMMISVVLSFRPLMGGSTGSCYLRFSTEIIILFVSKFTGRPNM